MESIALTIDLRDVKVLGDKPKAVSRELDKIESGRICSDCIG